jgi:hypothetical protein
VDTDLVATLTLYAHAAHYLWVMYIPPVLIVLFSIVKTVMSERRGDREESGGGEESKQ